MKETKAKLFNNGKSQAVRISADFRFNGTEVYIRKDPVTGDVTRSQEPKTWDEFFALLDQIPESERRDFLRDRNMAPPPERELRKTIILITCWTRIWSIISFEGMKSGISCAGR